jgi:hypothetical protein
MLAGRVNFWTSRKTSLHISFSKLCRQLIVGRRATLASKSNHKPLKIKKLPATVRMQGVDVWV